MTCEQPQGRPNLKYKKHKLHLKRRINLFSDKAKGRCLPLRLPAMTTLKDVFQAQEKPLKKEDVTCKESRAKGGGIAG